MMLSELEPLINNRTIEIFHYGYNAVGDSERIPPIRSYLSTDEIKQDKWKDKEVLWIEARSHEYGMLAIGIIDQKQKTLSKNESHMLDERDWSYD